MSHIVFTNYPGHLVALLLVAIVTAACVWSFRTRPLKRLPILRWALGILNLALVLALLVLAWNPSRVTTTERREPNTLLVCVDTSESMSVTDSAESRLDRALAAFDQHFANGQKDRPRCRWYGFDSELHPFSRTETDRHWGSRSDLERAMAKLNGIVQAEAEDGAGSELSPCGIVVFTDGQADNKQVRSYVELGQENCPTVIVGCGHNSLQQDLAISTVTAPVSIRAGQRYDITAQVVARRPEPQPIEVELWINDILSDRKAVALARQNEPQDVNFSTYALAPGTDAVRVVVRATERDLNARNNERTRLVEVQANAQMKVLLYSQIASFDMARIRQSLERDLKVQLDFVYDVLIDANLPKDRIDCPGRFPASAGQLDQYDLIVLGPCRFDRFSDEQIAGLYDFVTQGGGSVVFLAGREPFGPIACDIDTIDTLLPVAFDAPADAVPVHGLSLTDEGQDEHYSESVCDQSRSDDVDIVYTSIRKKPAASTVLRCGRQPLICTQRLGRGKTALVNSRNLYQLYREDQVDGPLFKLFADIVADTGERPQRQSHIEVFVRRSDDAKDLVFEACVTDQTYAPAQQATVLVEFEERIIRMDEAWPGTYMATIPDFQAASVFARVRVEHRDVYLGEKAVAVELDDIKGEMDDTRCDKAFLQALCEYTGAQYVDVNQVGPETFDRFQPYHTAQQDPQLKRIWPRWSVFAVLCSFLILQWFFRRAKGLI